MVQTNFKIRINDKGNDIIAKPLHSFSFKSITPFQTKFKTPVKKNNKNLHQQSLFLNDTDVKGDDEKQIYTRIPKHDSSFTTDKTLKEEIYSTIKKSTSTTPQESTSAINVQPHSRHIVNKKYLLMILPFSSTIIIFKISFFLMITH